MAERTGLRPRLSIRRPPAGSGCVDDAGAGHRAHGTRWTGPRGTRPHPATHDSQSLYGGGSRVIDAPMAGMTVRAGTVDKDGGRMRMLHLAGHAPSRSIDVPVLISALVSKGLAVANQLADGLLTRWAAYHAAGRLDAEPLDAGPGDEQRVRSLGADVVRSRRGPDRRSRQCGGVRRRRRSGGRLRPASTRAGRDHRRRCPRRDARVG